MTVENLKGINSAYQGSSLNLAAKPAISSVENIGKALAKNDGKNTETVVRNSNEKESDNPSKDQKNQIRKVVDEINKSRSGTQSEAIFGIHEETNRVTIKIVDKNSKKVIKEFPPEKTLDMIAKVWEMAGIMVDEKR